MLSQDTAPILLGFRRGWRRPRAVRGGFVHDAQGTVGRAGDIISWATRRDRTRVLGL